MRTAVRAVAETDGDKYSGHRMCGALFFVAPSHTIILSLYLPPPLFENIPWLVNHFFFFAFVTPSTEAIMT
jgi:hypothetical protein